MIKNNIASIISPLYIYIYRTSMISLSTSNVGFMNQVVMLHFSSLQVIIS
jgi:hypothetical protein